MKTVEIEPTPWTIAEAFKFAERTFQKKVLPCDELKLVDGPDAAQIHGLIALAIKVGLNCESPEEFARILRRPVAYVEGWMDGWRRAEWKYDPIRNPAPRGYRKGYDLGYAARKFIEDLQVLGVLNKGGAQSR